MRALDFALILLVVGGAAALALVLRSAAFELRARLYRILAGLAVGLVDRRIPVHRPAGSPGRRVRPAARRSAGTPSTRCSRPGSARRFSGSSASPRDRSCRVLRRPRPHSHARPGSSSFPRCSCCRRSRRRATPARAGAIALDRRRRARRGGVGVGRRAGLHGARSPPGRSGSLAAGGPSRSRLLDPGGRRSVVTLIRREASAATRRSRPSTGSGTRPTASSCWSRSGSFCRSWLSGPTTTASPSRG